MDSKPVQIRYRDVQIGILLSQEANWLLTESAKSSGRSKNKEVLLRLEDHLKTFPEINKSDYLGLKKSKVLPEKAKAYKPVRIVVQLSAALNRLLTESTHKSTLKKSKEAALRVDAHVLAVSSIAKVHDVTPRVIKGNAL